jgi:cytochrome P450
MQTSSGTAASMATARGSGWLPVLGHALTVLRDPLPVLDRWAGERGDFYRVRLLHETLWLVHRPEEIERILVAPRAFRRDSGVQKLRALLGEGLLTSEGELWKRQRRLMQPAFHRERIAGYAQRMVALTEERVARWPRGEVLDFNHEMMALTLLIASSTLFGDGAVDPEAVSAPLDVVMERFFGMTYLLPYWVPVPANFRFSRAVKRLGQTVEGVIARRRAQGATGGDLLSLLLSAQDEDGTGMSDGQIRDEVLTLLLAGHETTANALTWTGHLLSLHPEVDRALHDEASALSGPPAAADLPRLRYTEAVLTEAMRLYPPVWLMGREVVEPWEIAGVTLRPGDQAAMSQWVVHRDERFYRDARAFRPERWLDGWQKGMPAYAYFPFGGGQRLCIGKSFAMMEGTLVLAALARRVRFSPAPGFAPRPLPSITLRPAGGMMLRVDAR